MVVSESNLATDYIVVLVTTENRDIAEKISQTLLSEKLIACANIISPVFSCFLWQGKVKKAEECLVIMKTKRSLFGELSLCVKSLHSYEVPEIIALPIAEGSENYLSWIGTVVRQ
jgi:periplasmic divalent cation tolerance protein